MTQETRSLFLVGGFADEATRSMAEVAGSVGLQMALVSRCEEAPDTLGAASDPLAIVLRMDAEGAALACAHVRGQARLAQLPILCVAPQRDDLAFTELFSWGADDLVAQSSASPALARRLRPLVARTSPKREPKPRDKCAIVAGSDARWRSVMGRALYQGGFSVRFVAETADLAAESTAEGVRVVVFADDTGAAAEAAVTSARARGSEAAWIIVSPPKRMAALIGSIGSLPGVSIADGYAPPENVLFLTNELLSRRGVDQRASARVLYGTTVAFRPAGRDEDEIGFSYNVSAGGLYVRTLAALDAGQEIWLEMWPPRSERRVRLAGTVAWKRPFGPTEGATVPAGFGVKLTDGLSGDLDRWRAGYELFAESLLGTRGARPGSA